jgi:TRAP-type C4-dicarboxylate transport system permease small subunit
MKTHAAGESNTSFAKTEEQRSSLPPKWRAFDRAIIQTTKFSVFLIGFFFTAMVTLEVLSRYIFNFSIFFINAAARLLLVWFFLLGAGLGLREGAHVGFVIVLRALPGDWRRIGLLIGQFLMFIFFFQMVWSGLHTLGPSLGQSEPGLGISIFWVMISFPISFGLLSYHLITLVVVELRKTPTEDDRPWS